MRILGMTEVESDLFTGPDRNLLTRDVARD